MAVAHVGLGTDPGTAIGSSQTFAYPAGWSAGQFGVIQFESGNVAFDTPSGWTPIFSVGVGAGNPEVDIDATRTTAFGRFFEAGDSGSVTVTATSTGPRHIRGRMASYSGVDTTDPFTVSTGKTEASGSTSISTNSIASAAGDDDCLFLAIYATDRDSYTPSISSSAFAGVSATATTRMVAGTGSNGGGGYALIDGNPSADSTGAVSHSATLSQSSIWASALVRLNPTGWGGSSGATGTLAATEGADSAALTGDVLIDGTLAATEGADTASFVGDVLIDGALAATEGADTASLAGGVRVTGTLALSEANDTIAATGTIPIQGAIAASEANDTSSVTGVVPVSGTLAASEANDSALFNGGSSIQGSFALSEDSDTAALSGTVLIEGTLAANEANDTIAMSGASVVVGSFAASEGADVAALVGSVPIRGALAANDNPDSAAIAGVVPISGAAAASEAADTGSFGGLILIQGGLAASETNDTAAFTSLVIVFDFGDDIWTPAGAAVWKPTRSDATWNARDANETWVPRARSA